jgi:hypothetical protein
MAISACPHCGSKKVGIGRITDGVNPHEFLKQSCRNCGWNGFPLEFDNEKEYQKFLKDLDKKDEICDRNYYEDPTKSAPVQRYIIRSFWVVFLYILVFVTPALVYILISELAGLPNDIGVFFAFLSFFVYLYILWKKELWNLIKR